MQLHTKSYEEVQTRILTLVLAFCTNSVTNWQVLHWISKIENWSRFKRSKCTRRMSGNVPLPCS